MNISINHNIDGIKDFIEVFITYPHINETDIERLLSTKSYEKLISLFGKNIGLAKKTQWEEIFYDAYKLSLEDKQYAGSDIIKKNIIEPVIWAIKNINKLYSYTEKIERIVEKKEFIRKALKYLPPINCDIEIKFNYYIFMNNAAVEGNQVLIDIGFANQLSEVQLNDLLAHEMHHYLKDYINIYKQPQNGYNDVTLSLFTLENEGIADMCNFESLKYIYEKFGWMEKGLLMDILINSNKYINQLNNILKIKLVENNNHVNIYEFLMQNQIVHPLGYKMARTIEEYLGLDELRDCVGNPLKFISKFNTAFEMENSKKAFDDEVIEKLCFIYNNR
ncbi:hypothetical protein Pmob_1433 [Petrotoga mobilis SJ95]|uniref:Uncharacterized protein n=1 Tax=Petrotoga mobilis (strain DSM 10674 / SJ95) TaxID=403833 RepID=A9BI21_PETMO|nr:DUF5700 domain-containing putative Zn-dependent protease [Petrotoga mobilis]ABX32136.1 hypothetical protein Pmob_1433 [Petrotoga mobilis SJ95]